MCPTLPALSASPLPLLAPAGPAAAAPRGRGGADDAAGDSLWPAGHSGHYSPAGPARCARAARPAPARIRPRCRVHSADGARVRRRVCAGARALWPAAAVPHSGSARIATPMLHPPRATRTRPTGTPCRPYPTQQLGGNVSLALLLTVASNILGIFTMPFVLPHVVAASGVQGAAVAQGAAAAGMLEPLPLMLQLCQTILVPTLIGASIRGFIPGAGTAGGAGGACCLEPSCNEQSRFWAPSCGPSALSLETCACLPPVPCPQAPPPRSTSAASRCPTSTPACSRRCRGCRRAGVPEGRGQAAGWPSRSGLGSRPCPLPPIDTISIASKPGFQPCGPFLHCASPTHRSVRPRASTWRLSPPPSPRPPPPRSPCTCSSSQSTRSLAGALLLLGLARDRGRRTWL
jgi:hypothetical protein